VDRDEAGGAQEDQQRVEHVEGPLVIGEVVVCGDGILDETVDAPDKDEDARDVDGDDEEAPAGISGEVDGVVTGRLGGVVGPDPCEHEGEAEGRDDEEAESAQLQAKAHEHDVAAAVDLGDGGGGGDDGATDDLHEERDDVEADEDRGYAAGR